MPTTTPTAMATVFGLLSSSGAADGVALGVTTAAAVDVGAALVAFGVAELLLLETTGS